METSGLSGIGGYAGVASSVIGLFTSYAGSMQSAKSAKLAAERARVAAQFEADQMDQAAGQSFAAGQQAALEQLRQTRLTQSRAIALAAAGGGGVSDVTVVNLLSRNAGEGAYRAALAVYQGAEQARKLRMAAAAKRYEGDLQFSAGQDKATAYNMQGFGNAFTQGVNLYTKYGKAGGDGPGAKSPDVNYVPADTSTIDMGV